MDPLEALEGLRTLGVGDENIPRWHRLVQSNEGSLSQLVKSVEAHGSLQKAVAVLGQKRRTLLAEENRLSLSVDSLNQERTSVIDELLEMREEMFALSVGRKEHEREADELGRFVQLARALITTDPQEIRNLSVESVFCLIGWIELWLMVTGYDGSVASRDSTRKLPWTSFFAPPSLGELIKLALETPGMAIMGRR